MHLPFPIVLASGSPRRRELLKSIVESFEVLVSEVDEALLTVVDPWKTAEGLSLAKASAVAELRPNSLVIGGDTVVAVEGDSYEQLAKPANEAEAVQMLQRLSGRTHLVITGVSLIWPHAGHYADRMRSTSSGKLSENGRDTFSVTSRVTFRPLTDQEIGSYVSTGEPMDKAGAYAIQGGAAEFVQGLEGSLSNVVGLPIDELKSRLEVLWPAQRL